jgi:hypothetical protein
VALGGLFFGLALLTKQIQALLILLIILTYLVATKKASGSSSLNALQFLGCGATCFCSVADLYDGEFWLGFLAMVPCVLRRYAGV